MNQTLSKLFDVFWDRFEPWYYRFRMPIIVGISIFMVAISNIVAFLLRFEGDVPLANFEPGVKAFPVLLMVFFICLWMFGVFRGLWRYVGTYDLFRIVYASAVGGVLFYGLVYRLLGITGYPRSVIILTSCFTIGFLAGTQLASRWLRERFRILDPSAQRVLIVGAGNAGELLVRDILTDPKYNCRPVGFVDDDPIKQGAKIHGVSVLGTISEIKKVVERSQPHEMIVAIPSGTRELKQKVLLAAELCKIPIKTLPSLQERLSDVGSMKRVRPMRLEDLLQRDPVRSELLEVNSLIEGKRILVTGAGGSIGSELCRQIAGYQPALLILIERHENSLYQIDGELRQKFPELTIAAIVADITDRGRMAALFSSTTPHLVFHAAAHKHVPLMEENPGEAIRNNIFGTQVIGEMSLEAGVEEFVLISTDKAINPVSVMGMTKRLAECLIQEWNRRGMTRFTAVRFGNVLGSNGSVVPLFKEQIEKGGPVTVTHPDVTRYFMTIPEAVQLVLQASVMSQGGDIFVLNMGEPIRVADLAKHMIVLSGLVPDQDILILYTGLRPGEKMNEELFNVQEQVGPTGHSKINRAVGRLCPEGIELIQPLRELQSLLDSSDPQAIVQKLRDIVIGQTQPTVESKK